MPSTGSPYAKPVKNIFVAPSKYVYVGSDFASLEDRISALTTKDSNKLKVYIGVNKYIITLNGKDIAITGNDTIVYKGKSYTGDEFYALYKDSKL